MNQEPFFIIGSQRGGTTLLRLMLNKHSALAIPPESHFFIPLLKQFSPGKQLTKQELEKAATIIYLHPRFYTWGISKEELNNILESVAQPYYLSHLITKIFRYRINKSGKPKWGDKTPEYIDIIPGMLALFPEASFIAFIRDGRDVSVSLKERGWQGWSIYQRARYWQKCFINIQFLAHSHKKTILVKYEDLVLQPRKTLSTITKFLDVAFEEQMLNFHEDYREHITTREMQSGVHHKLERQPQPDDIYRWRTMLSAKEVWKFESVCHKELELAGYEVVCFRKNNILHQWGRYCYAFTGMISSAVYRIYHHLFSSKLKKNMRNNNAYMQLRQLVRKL